MKKITCKCCGFIKEIEIITMQDVKDSGFDFIWDISDGLTPVYFCKECSSKIINYVHAIEDMVGIRIDYINLGTMSNTD